MCNDKNIHIVLTNSIESHCIKKCLEIFGAEFLLINCVIIVFIFLKKGLFRVLLHIEISPQTSNYNVKK